MTVITGTLTDYALMTEGQFAGYYGARIDDKPYVVMHHVDAFLLLRLKKGQRVEASLNKDGHISKIILVKDSPESSQDAGPDPDKLKKHGFGEPTPGPAPVEQKQEEKKDCTSSETPANPALKTVEGQITFIDPAAHKITVKDRAGISHTMVWPPALHDKMIQQKQWWFIKITGEHQADVDIWKLISADFFKRPEDWPVSQHGGGSRPFVPRNEKPIIYQCCYKEQMANFRQNFPGLFEGFDEGDEEHLKQLGKVMDWYVTRACEDAARLVRESGA